MPHISDRFIAAVHICTGSLPVKQRLTEAWLTQLDDISPDDLPAQLRQEFMALRTAMYKHKPQPNEPAPKASIRKMSAGQATRYTTMIVKLLGEILRVKYAMQNIQIGTADNSVFEVELESSNYESNQHLN